MPTASVHSPVVAVRVCATCVVPEIIGSDTSASALALTVIGALSASVELPEAVAVMSTRTVLPPAVVGSL